ncbi:hypothetical protein JB92DRAFT_2838878 [Gautieria morchelliformis]|nr:hypothetical protein JB92DRAFT_2838878 [Gautieria morchelliformis]
MLSKATNRDSTHASRPKRKERQRFDNACGLIRPVWHETGGALDEQTTETQWFEQSVGGSGWVQSPKKLGRAGRRALASKVKKEPDPGTHQWIEPAAPGAAAGSGTGSGLSEVYLDGTEEIDPYDESMAAGWSQDESSLPPDNGGREGFLQRGSLVTAGRTVMGTGGDPVALPRATVLGSQETLWAIEHPMASAMASTDNLAWLGGRAGMGPAWTVRAQTSSGNSCRGSSELQSTWRARIRWANGAGCWNC